jgi:N-acyl-D-aspartate/D-glutamate deacylase
VTWGEAIRRVTGLPASIVRLPDRGTIGVGQAADIVVLDPTTIRDRATYAEPDQAPDGIEHVLVAGRRVIDRGEATRDRPGRVLRRVAA